MPAAGQSQGRGPPLWSMEPTRSHSQDEHRSQLRHPGSLLEHRTSHFPSAGASLAWEPCLLHSLAPPEDPFCKPQAASRHTRSSWPANVSFAGFCLSLKAAWPGDPATADLGLLGFPRL